MSAARRSPSTLGLTVAGRALVRVRGASMQPTLNDGDLLLVKASGPVTEGALILVRLPGRPGLAVKRATRHEPDGWWVERDNPREGVDSWTVGVIPETDIVAKVVARVWPRRRIEPAPPV